MPSGLLLSGSSEVSLDDKGRFAMPVRYRRLLSDECDGEITITRSLTEPCLWIYPATQWESVVKSLSTLPTLADKVARAVQRMILGSAVCLKPDSQNRILLPPELRKAANLEHKAVLIGFANKFELWSEDVLAAQRSSDEELLKESLTDFSTHEALSALKL